jgi:hypothetical protein
MDGYEKKLITTQHYLKPSLVMYQVIWNNIQKQ